MLPRGAGVYTESEVAFERLLARDYAAWVAATFPWKVQGALEPDEIGRLRKRLEGTWDDKSKTYDYALMVRAPDDPERQSRARQRENLKGWGGHWKSAKSVPVLEVRDAIMSATQDGRPRTLNRIALETLEITADMLPANVWQAVSSLIWGGQLAYASVYSPASRPRAWHEVVLLWNDAIWQREFGGRRTYDLL